MGGGGHIIFFTHCGGVGAQEAKGEVLMHKQGWLGLLRELTPVKKYLNTPKTEVHFNIPCQGVFLCS